MSQNEANEYLDVTFLNTENHVQVCLIGLKLLLTILVTFLCSSKVMISSVVFQFFCSYLCVKGTSDNVFQHWMGKNNDCIALK